MWCLFPVTWMSIVIISFAVRHTVLFFFSGNGTQNFYLKHKRVYCSSYCSSHRNGLSFDTYKRDRPIYKTNFIFRSKRWSYYQGFSVCTKQTFVRSSKYKPNFTVFAFIPVPYSNRPNQTAIGKFAKKNKFIL